MENQNESEMSKQLEEAQQIIATYQVQQILSNQVKFNEWMMTQVLALKDGVNQIGLILSEVTEQQEEVKVEEPKPEVKPIVKKQGFMAKLGMAAKNASASVESAVKDTID